MPWEYSENTCEKWLPVKSWMNWYSITTRRIRTTKCTPTSGTKSTTMWTPMTTLTTGRHSTSTIAWRFTTCTSTKSSTELAHVVLFLAHFITLTLAQVRALSALHSRPSSWPSMWLLSLRLDFLLLPLRLPPVLLPLRLLPPQRRAAAGAQPEDHGKLALLRDQRSEGTYDVLYFPTGYVTSTSSRTHRSTLSYKIPAADQDVDDLTLGKMLTEAYRGQVDYFVQEGGSVSQLSSSVRSDRSGNLMEIDRGNPMSAKAQKHRSGLYFRRKDRQFLRNVMLESVTTNSKQLKPKKSADSFKDNHGNRRNFVKLINEVLQRWKNYGNFWVLHSILGKTKIHRGSEHYLGTRPESTGIAKWSKLYKRFWGFSGCWINTQWKFPRYQSTSVIPTSSNTWRDVETFFHNAEPQRRAAKHLGHTWYIGKRFCKSTCIFISSLSSRIESMEFVDRRAAPFVHIGEKLKARTKSRSEMPVWTVSQRFSHLQWEETLQRIMGQTNNDCRFRIFTLTNSLHEQPLLAGR